MFLSCRAAAAAQQPLGEHGSGAQNLVQFLKESFQQRVSRTASQLTES